MEVPRITCLISSAQSEKRPPGALCALDFLAMFLFRSLYDNLLLALGGLTIMSFPHPTYFHTSIL